MELGKDTYVNGQKSYEVKGDILTFYYKDGSVRAEGGYENGKMQGKWTFFRATGQLWEIGHMKDDIKEGSWVRYDRNDNVELDEFYKNGKKVKKQ